MNYEQRLLSLHISSLKQRRTLTYICLLFKILNNMVDVDLLHNFKFNAKTNIDKVIDSINKL